MANQLLTFVFVAVDGSTHRWEQYPDAMRTAQVQYGVAIRQAVAAHQGIVFQEANEGFYIAFADANAAITTAIELQKVFILGVWPRELGQLQARIAIHSGLAEVHNDNYFSPTTFNRLSRILAATHPQQILVSEATVELASLATLAATPLVVQMRDLGERQLRDIGQPLHLYQVLAADLPQDFLPVKTLDRRPTNLPAPPTSFVGREAEITAVCNLLRQPNVQLVTLSGPGGTGKTRLSLEVAANLLDEYEDGVFFVPLAPITESSLVASTVAHTLGQQEVGGEEIAATLCRYLSDKQMLLVFDNFEQVVEAADFVATLLTAAPRLKILVSSRESLHLAAEYEYLLAPLTLPNLEHLPPFAELAAYPVMQLFAQRAQAAKYNFALTEQNAATVAEICVRLDGLPLAIELAAARSKQLAPTQILTQLDHRLTLLVSEFRNLTPRQRSLRGAIEWSYTLLEPAEKLLFQRLAVFVGGCDVSAATTVCSGDGISLDEVPTLLAQLADKSLVQEQTQGAAMRYLMLETIREYALLVVAEAESQTTRYTLQKAVREYAQEQLTAAGEEAILRERHADYYLALVEQGEPHLLDAEQGHWLDLYEIENDNIRAALTWLYRQAQAVRMMRLVTAFWRFWYTRGYVNEGRGWLEAALTLSEGDDSELRAKTLNAGVAIANTQGDNQAAVAFGEEGLAIARQLNDKPRIAGLLNSLGIIAINEARYQEARVMFIEALAIERESSNRSRLAIVASNLATATDATGGVDEAIVLFREAEAIHREQGNKWGLSIVLTNLGDIMIASGNLAQARQLLQESSEISEQVGSKAGVFASLRLLSKIAEIEGDLATAQALHERSLSFVIESGDKHGLSMATADAANLAYKRGDLAAARANYRQSVEIIQHTKATTYEAALLEGIARLTANETDAEIGAQMLGVASALRAKIGNALRANEAVTVANVREQLIALLGVERFDACYAQGQQITAEQVVDYVLNSGII